MPIDNCFALCFTLQVSSRGFRLVSRSEGCEHLGGYFETLHTCLIRVSQEYSRMFVEELSQAAKETNLNRLTGEQSLFRSHSPAVSLSIPVSLSFDPIHQHRLAHPLNRTSTSSLQIKVKSFQIATTLNFQNFLDWYGYPSFFCLETSLDAPC